MGSEPWGRSRRGRSRGRPGGGGGSREPERSPGEPSRRPLGARGSLPGPRAEAPPVTPAGFPGQLRQGTRPPCRPHAAVSGAKPPWLPAALGGRRPLAQLCSPPSSFRALLRAEALGDQRGTRAGPRRGQRPGELRAGPRRPREPDPEVRPCARSAAGPAQRGSAVTGRAGLRAPGRGLRSRL